MSRVVWKLIGKAQASIHPKQPITVILRVQSSQRPFLFSTWEGLGLLNPEGLCFLYLGRQEDSVLSS